MYYSTSTFNTICLYIEDQYKPNVVEEKEDFIKNIIRFKNNFQNNYDIALTKFMILPKETTDIFWENYEENKLFFKNNSKPLWNGEDIFINLLYIKNKNKKH